jgi:hypothetical protein
MKIELWVDGYSNSGTKIKTSAIKAELLRLQVRYPERKYELTRQGGLWYLAEGDD